MNVDELGADNGIKLWIFFTTSIGLTAIVLIVWGVVSGKLSEVWRKRPLQKSGGKSKAIHSV
jgi:hypothetical protein